MFIRTRERANGKVTIQIAESVRVNGKVDQKILRTVATVMPSEVDTFLRKESEKNYTGYRKAYYIDITDNNKYVVQSKPSQEAIKMYDVMNKKRVVVPFRLTTET